MIDLALYGITPKLQEKLEERKKRIDWFVAHGYTKAAEMLKNAEFRIKPFYDFAKYCRAEDDGPYNPENQVKYVRVYERDDTLSKEEFEALSEFNKVQYVLYHQWKNGEITKEQLKNFNWMKLIFPKV